MQKKLKLGKMERKKYAYNEKIKKEGKNFSLFYTFVVHVNNER